MTTLNPSASASNIFPITPIEKKVAFYRSCQDKIYKVFIASISASCLLWIAEPLLPLAFIASPLYIPLGTALTATVFFSFLMLGIDYLLYKESTAEVQKEQRYRHILISLNKSIPLPGVSEAEARCAITELCYNLELFRKLLLPLKDSLTPQFLSKLALEYNTNPSLEYYQMLLEAGFSPFASVSPTIAPFTFVLATPLAQQPTIAQTIYFFECFLWHTKSDKLESLRFLLQERYLSAESIDDFIQSHPDLDPTQNPYIRLHILLSLCFPQQDRYQALHLLDESGIDLNNKISQIQHAMRKPGQRPMSLGDFIRASALHL